MKTYKSYFIISIILSFVWFLLFVITKIDVFAFSMAAALGCVFTNLIYMISPPED